MRETTEINSLLQVEELAIHAKENQDAILNFNGREDNRRMGRERKARLCFRNLFDE